MLIAEFYELVPQQLYERRFLLRSGAPPTLAQSYDA